MKSDVMTSRVQLRQDVLSQLVQEVKETVATEVLLSAKKETAFRAVNLWKIQRSGKQASASVRRQAL